MHTPHSEGFSFNVLLKFLTSVSLCVQKSFDAALQGGDEILCRNESGCILTQTENKNKNWKTITRRGDKANAIVGYILHIHKIEFASR